MVELLVTLAIIGMVFGVVINVVAALGRQERDKQRMLDLRTIQSALAQYYADQHFYPQAGFNTDVRNGGVPLTDCSGNPSCSSPSKTYLESLPEGTNGSYCYSAQIAAGDTSVCDNNNSSTTQCQWYALCARLEDAPNPSPSPSPNPAASCPCNSNANNANYVVTPTAAGQ